MKIVTLAILILLSSTLASAKMYKWVDENGSIHFSDTPPIESKVEVYVPESQIDVSSSGGENGARKSSSTSQRAPKKISKREQERKIKNQRETARRKEEERLKDPKARKEFFDELERERAEYLKTPQGKKELKEQKRRDKENYKDYRRRMGEIVD